MLTFSVGLGNRSMENINMKHSKFCSPNVLINCYESLIALKGPIIRQLDNNQYMYV